MSGRDERERAQQALMLVLEAQRIMGEKARNAPSDALNNAMSNARNALGRSAHFLRCASALATERAGGGAG